MNLINIYKMKITGSESANPIIRGNSFTTGITIRQQFAMVAMQGLLAGERAIEYGEGGIQYISKTSVRLADALI
jgi:hypothetical protein